MRAVLVSLLMVFFAQAAGACSLLVFGDSLSAGYGLQSGEGWVDLLQRRLQKQETPCTVINASISGDTSAGGLARLKPVLTQHKPDILLLELGANDGLRGLSLSAMKNNLNSIIKQAKGAGAKVLLIGMQMPPNYGPRYTERFHKIYQELAHEQQIPFVPFLMESVAMEPSFMQPDNFHPNAQAQPLLLKTVWAYLQPMLASLIKRKAQASRHQ